MSAPRHIPWFNPREMDDATVQALSTGRDALLEGFFQAVRQRLDHPQPGGHWLVLGPRGAGKSFFLRLVQVCFQEAFGDAAQFVLLPEEHSNIFAPHEWLEEIRRMALVEQGHTGTSPAWRVADEAQAWSQALQALFHRSHARRGNAAPDAPRPESPSGVDSRQDDAERGSDKPLLVVGVENFDQLLQQAFSDEVAASRLRSLLEGEPRLLLLATAVQGDFDEDYGQRLFRQFEHHTLPLWDEAAHGRYLQRRAALQGKLPSSRQMARIQAYSRYTGGNARVAAVLAGAILDEQDPLLTSADLHSTLDRMTDYYRALHARIPPNSRKLFDALIRGGEPASQSEIAERSGAKQNEISRAFAWLVDYGYVLGEKAPGRKEWRYRVADRLFVQFYHMRYLQPGQRSRLSLLADLLADAIEFSDKWRHVERYLHDGHEDGARVMAELALQERQIDLNRLAPAIATTARLVQMGLGWEKWDTVTKAGDELAQFEEIFRSFSCDEEFRQAYEEARELVRAVHRGEVQGSQLVLLLEGNLTFSPAEKYRLLVWMLTSKLTESLWSGLIRSFENEAEAFKRFEFNERAFFSGKLSDTFRRRHELGRAFPLAYSFQNLAEKINRKGDVLKNAGAGTAARWAAKAAALWLSQQKEHPVGWIESAKPSEKIQPDAVKQMIAKPIDGLPQQIAQEAESALEICFSALERLLGQVWQAEAVLEVFALLEPHLNDLPINQRARLLRYQGRSLEALNRYAEAYSAYAMAREAELQAQAPSNATWDLQRMSWCLGAQGRLVEAIAGHRQVYEELSIQQWRLPAARSLGQMARHTIRQASLNAAWNLLDTQLNTVELSDASKPSFRQGMPTAAAAEPKSRDRDVAGLRCAPSMAMDPGIPCRGDDTPRLNSTALDTQLPQQEDYRIEALQQLGDAVWDAARLDGEAKAFALGRQLLEGLAARPQYPAQAAVRALWIDMIDMGVPHSVLRDLLGEISALFGENADLAMLRQILAAWLDDLDCPPDERAARRQTLDPDLATTLESLAQHLSPKARARLQLST